MEQEIREFSASTTASGVSNGDVALALWKGKHPEHRIVALTGDRHYLIAVIEQKE